MNRRVAVRFLASLSIAAIGACTTPYPDGTPIAGATLDTNRAPRGSAAFCETYARQSAANAYEANAGDDGSLGSNLIELQRAKVYQRRAYERCRAGRTG